MTKCRLLLFPQPWKEITFRIAPLTITIFEAVNFWSHSIRFVMSYSLLWCGITSQMWSVHWSVARMFFPIIEHFGVWRNNTTKIICNNNHHQVLACLNILIFGAWKWSCKIRMYAKRMLPWSHQVQKGRLLQLAQCLFRNHSLFCWVWSHF